MKDKPSPVKNENILEIRFKPNPKILDNRGSWAEEISTHMNLVQWEIVGNRIDIFSEGKATHAFVGFRNAGLTLLDSPTKIYFPDQAIKLLKFIFQLEGFGDPIVVERLGVRSKFCTPFNGSFEKLKDRYSAKYLILTPAAKSAIGQDSKLIDVGGPLNFVDKLGNFNTMSGPMKSEQFRDFFTRDDGFPDIGLYFDIDYWIKPNEEMYSKKIIPLVRDFAYTAWDRHERVRDLILGE